MRYAATMTRLLVMAVVDIIAQKLSRSVRSVKITLEMDIFRLVRPVAVLSVTPIS